MNLAPRAVEFVKEELKKAAGAKAIVTAKADGESYTFTIRPGGDLQKLARKIGFGSVANIDEESRTINVEPDPEKVPQEPAVIAENPAHKQYLEMNLLLLKGANPEQRQAALDKLCVMDPSKAPNNELKMETARAMRERALDAKDAPENRVKAVEGLIVWAGPYSVKVLIEVLKDKDPTVRQAALKGLETYKDEGGDRAVGANRLRHRRRSRGGRWPR